MGFILFIWDVRVSVGVGFIYLIIGIMSIMFGFLIWFCFFEIDMDFEIGMVMGLL